MRDIYNEDEQMAVNTNIETANPFQNATNPIHFKNIEGLKETLDEIDFANIRTSFKAAKDPIYLAFDHIDKQPLKKVAKDFVKEVKNGVIEFVTSIPEMFAGIQA